MNMMVTLFREFPEREALQEGGRLHMFARLLLASELMYFTEKKK